MHDAQEDAAARTADAPEWLLEALKNGREAVARRDSLEGYVPLGDVDHPSNWPQHRLDELTQADEAVSKTSKAVYEAFDRYWGLTQSGD